jgi:hypothetical protein
LVAPSGTVNTEGPTYEWEAGSDATEYQLYVTDLDLNIVVSEWHDAADVCSGSSCSLTPSTTLAEGGYRWWVRARNAAGSTWSTDITFDVDTG